MQIFQKEIQTNLFKYGSVRGIIEKAGISGIFDFLIIIFFYRLSSRIYRPNGLKYGLFEAFFCLRGIDRWKRNMHVAAEIYRAKNAIILEIGSGGRGVSGFLNPKRNDLDFVLFDVRKDAFNGLKGKNCILGDGCKLPFRDKVIDIIVSVDVVEHIPKSVRHSFYEEAKRVGSKEIILTCPIQSKDGEFQGRKYDIIFQSIYQKNCGTKEPNTAQHIGALHPTLEEIKRAFPNSKICGTRNADVWLRCMVVQSKPILGLFCGILYYLFWKKNEDKPPYWGAIITSNFEKFGN